MHWKKIHSQYLRICPSKAVWNGIYFSRKYVDNLTDNVQFRHFILKETSVIFTC